MREQAVSSHQNTQEANCTRVRTKHKNPHSAKSGARHPQEHAYWLTTHILAKIIPHQLRCGSIAVEPADLGCGSFTLLCGVDIAVHKREQCLRLGTQGACMTCARDLRDANTSKSMSGLAG